MKRYSQNKRSASQSIGVAIFELVIGAAILLPVFMIIFQFSQLAWLKSDLNTQLASFIQREEIFNKANLDHYYSTELNLSERQVLAIAEELYQLVDSEHENVGIQVAIKSQDKNISKTVGQMRKIGLPDLDGDYLLFKAQTKLEDRLICKIFGSQLCDLEAIRSLPLR